MECNIYAHHQIKTVFLYFLLGKNGTEQQPRHENFFVASQDLKEANFKVRFGKMYEQ